VNLYLTLRYTQLINAFGTISGHKDARILSMSTSNELDPGPKSCGEHGAPDLVHGLSMPMESLKVQAKARRVGWGGFAGG